MKYRMIANSDVKVSALSLGTVKFGRNQSVKYPTAFDLPKKDDLSSLLETAFRLGITTLDTAPAYGLSEERLGELLKNKRKQWQIITKAGENFNATTNSSSFDFSTKGLRNSLENSLKKLNTDYLDCWMIHSDGDDTARLNDDVIHCLHMAKQQGWVRSIGMSTKTLEGGAYALQHLDCIMMSASLDNQAEIPLFKIAESLGKSVILKKIYNSGWALTQENKSDIMQKTLHLLMQQPCVASAVIGTINPEHLAENVAAFQAAMEIA